MFHKEINGIMAFDFEYFESILPRRKSNDLPLWRRGINAGELIYWIEIDDPKVELLIRSSIDPVTNFSKPKAKDSIRIYLVKSGTLEYISVKCQRWTTRQSGWEQRLMKQLSTMRKWRINAGDCPVCKEPKFIFKVKNKTSKHVGRLFAKCMTHEKTFKYIT